MKVATVQQKNSADYEYNLQKSIDLIEQAAALGAELILLQELHTSLYFCQTEDVNVFDLAEPIPSRTTDRLGACAKRLGVVIVASLFEKRAAGLYHNTAVVLEKDGTIAGKYRKMHIPDDPAYYEKFYFTPGDLGFTPIQTSVGKLGVLVCWDQWYPEAARLMALAGADYLLYPTAIGWDSQDTLDEQQRQLDAWQTIQRAHAIANHLPVLVANRSGFEADPSGVSAGSQFWGNSFICDPQGVLLAQASADDDTVLCVELEAKRSETLRRIWPFLRDRRIDAYGDLTRRYRD
ncbi:MAG TPA: carbon-nitrogen hydrolase [Thiothrix sp.]|nr:carbon-nitrogen hydrolase [Thiothrix sp.]